MDIGNSAVVAVGQAAADLAGQLLFHFAAGAQSAAEQELGAGSWGISRAITPSIGRRLLKACPKLLGNMELPVPNELLPS